MKSPDQPHALDDQQKKLRDEYFGRTPHSEEHFSERHKQILKIFVRMAPKKFLDIGCGDGNYTRILQRSTGSVAYGIDISESAIKTAGSNGIIAFQIDMNMSEIPLHDNSLDLVLGCEVIEHLFNVDHFLSEIYRVLEPGGIFIMSTPNLSSLYNRLSLMFSYEPFSNNLSLEHNIGHIVDIETSNNSVPSGDHIRVSTLRSILSLLAIYNFDIVETHGSTADFSHAKNKGLLMSMISAFDRIISKIPSLSYRVIIVSRKRASK